MFRSGLKQFQGLAVGVMRSDYSADQDKVQTAFLPPRCMNHLETEREKRRNACITDNGSWHVAC